MRSIARTNARREEFSQGLRGLCFSRNWLQDRLIKAAVSARPLGIKVAVEAGTERRLRVIGLRTSGLEIRAPGARTLMTQTLRGSELISGECIRGPGGILIGPALTFALASHPISPRLVSSRARRSSPDTKEKLPDYVTGPQATAAVSYRGTISHVEPRSRETIEEMPSALSSSYNEILSSADPDLSGTPDRLRCSPIP